MTSHRNRPVWRLLLANEDNTLGRIDVAIFRGGVLLMLALGASSSIFRQDAEAYFVSIVCIGVLTFLAGVAMFRRKP